MPESAQTVSIICYAIVMVITNEYLIHFLHNYRKRLCPHVPYFPVDFLAFLCKFLPAGLPLYPKFSVPSMGTVMCEPQKCKCLRLLAFLCTSLFCKSSKLYQSGFAFFQGQSELSHSFPQMFIEQFCVLFVLKCCDKIVRIYRQAAVAFKPRLHLFPEPPYQHIVHVNVCYHW